MALRSLMSAVCADGSSLGRQTNIFFHDDMLKKGRDEVALKTICGQNVYGAGRGQWSLVSKLV